MSPLSTKQVAARIGIHRATLEAWLSSGRVPHPKTVTVGDRRLRLWSEGDVRQLLQLKDEIYRKGRGRRKKPER
jgi:excisionase family DNA binding protein